MDVDKSSMPILSLHYLRMKSILMSCFLLLHIFCTNPENQYQVPPRMETQRIDTIPASPTKPAANNNSLLKNKTVTNVSGDELVTYARTLIGVPYKYASAIPSKGFDCSGFITYVFNHFAVEVPRTSRDFTNLGQNIDKATARQGDLILFTGTADSIRIVGHMGIVTENTDSLRFIHSTSGRANGVTITALNKHYQRRFLKVIRVLAE